MLISEVIKLLEQKKKELGDCRIVVIDGDTGWAVKPIETDFDYNETYKRVEIDVGYPTGQDRYEENK